MGRRENRWISDDGQEFLTESEMLLHELAIIDKKEIEAFLMTQEVSKRRLNEYIKLLTSWQSYIRNSQLPKQNNADEKQLLEEVFAFPKHEEDTLWDRAETFK